ncbi:MAG TPA: heme-dependent oxidative N-demethylase subunit alpha family protein [Ramlibacter sp.]|nr:heme-dependent oxidative N-demethylase subunit alpha family protein [Ramlibacter sp.]
MDFDLTRIAVPFRMQPGLRRVAPDGVRPTPLDPASALYAEKKSVVDSGSSRHAIPGFDPSPALRAIADRGGHHAGPAELAFEEDFAVLDAATGRLPWLCICVPSHWAPEEKIGLDFATLHAPVADNAALLAASQQLVALVTAGECWERFVWTITPSARYDQNPRRHSRAPWPDAGDAQSFADACWLRAERQCFFPVGEGTRQAVFTIRVMLQRLSEAVQTAGAGQRLRDALATMSPAVLEYKGLTAARAPLLEWLAPKSG